MKILVTGAAGFIGRHMVDALGRRADTEVFGYDVGNSPQQLDGWAAQAEAIIHLAGVNRPQKVEEFTAGNADFTATLCAKTNERQPPLIVMSSSIQAALDNPYGISKRQAELALEQWAAQTTGRAAIFRLKNVFGKWCRPNYNSVTATFCHNLAHDLPIVISDPSRELELVYIDDVVAAFLAVLDGKSVRSESPVAGCPSPSSERCRYYEAAPAYKVTLGTLAARIQSFRDSRKTLIMPSFEDEFNRKLYATYLSYLEGPQFSYGLDIKNDARGNLAEFMKSAPFGQLFVSRTKPGITRGNHYHHTKTEKFLVVEGEAMIRFRQIAGTEVIEHRISGRDYRVVDIPPGYTHSIENVGSTEMVVLFWASEIFNPAKPDTYAAPVLPEGAG